MLHLNVHRLTAAVALVLVLAAAPALAASGPRPHATQPPVAGLSLIEQILGWLGFPAAEGLPGLHGTYEKSTTATPVSASSTELKLPRGVLIDPNG